MKINKLYISILFLITILGFSSCKDNMMEEITDLDVDRAFSPTGLSAAVVNRTGVRLNWNAVNNAKTYTVEIFENTDFSGTPFRVLSDITYLQVPYTVTDLSGDTQYAIRVKAVGEGVDDSKYVSASIKTDSEQIFEAVNPAKLTSNSVVLNWPAGQRATSITLSPGNITKTVTAAEIAAGEATITGLLGETAYTATLLNGTKIRGTATFTTLLDLGGATPVYPTDDLAALMTNANDGAVFALFPGTYTINADVVVSKSIALKGARPTNKPIIKGMVTRLTSNAGLELKDLEIDGIGALNGNQTIIYDQASTNAYGNLLVENCTIKNYVKGLMYINVAAMAETITFRNNIIYNIEANGGDFIDFRNGLTKTFNFVNNTVYASAIARDFFRMDAGGSTNFPSVTSVINITTNTLNGMCNGVSRRLLYIRLANHQINFSKNIVANSAGIHSNQAATVLIPANFIQNNYFNSPTYLGGGAATNIKYDTGTATTIDPGFTSAATGNFTVSDITLKINGIGDPRWRQ